MRRFGVAVFVFGVLVSCGDDGVNCDAPEQSSDPECGPTIMDQDNDGVPDGEDCDDADETLGAQALDQDCDGTLTDADCDDTNADSTVRAEDQDCDGSLTEADCDDTDPSIYPGAEEDWTDGIDSDCDGNEDSVCGDGLLGNIETCDDGNVAAEDGCSETCQIEPQCSEGCASTEECDTGETCVGRPSSVAGATGQCEDTSVNPAGSWDACDEGTPCGPDLVCMGLYVWGNGYCVPDWQAKTFHQYAAVEIPDDGTVVSSPVVACGLASVPEDILVVLHLDHPRTTDLVIELEDPNEQKGIVLDQQEWTPGQIVVRVGSGDDMVNGQWTLHVKDTVAGETGRLMGWSVYLVSRWD